MKRALTRTLAAGAAILAVASFALMAAPAFAAPQSCPNADASKSAAYKDAFDNKCRNGIRNWHAADGGITYWCTDTSARSALNDNLHIPAPSAQDISDWMAGCTDGWNKGQELLATNLTARSTTLAGVQSTCADTADTNLQNGTPDSQKQKYIAGCTDGFILAANGTSYNSCFQMLGAFYERGCTDGGTLASQGALTAKGTNQTEVTRRCNIEWTSLAVDKMSQDQFVIMCRVGYIGQLNGQPKDSPNICGGGSISADAKTACEKGYNLAAADVATSNPTNPDTFSAPGALVPDCNPTLSPSQPGACGVAKFIELVKNVIKYITFTAFPLAALMIGWGGIQIMTAAGSTEKVSKGKSAIRIAITGLVIILVSYLLIRAIFIILGVDSSITSSIFGTSGIY